MTKKQYNVYHNVQWHFFIFLLKLKLDENQVFSILANNSHSMRGIKKKTFPFNDDVQRGQSLTQPCITV